MLAIREVTKRPFRKHTSTLTPTKILYHERRNPTPVVAYIGPERRVHTQINLPSAPASDLGNYTRTSKHETHTP